MIALSGFNLLNITYEQKPIITIFTLIHIESLIFLLKMIQLKNSLRYVPIFLFQNQLRKGSNSEKIEHANSYLCCRNASICRP